MSYIYMAPIFRGGDLSNATLQSSYDALQGFLSTTVPVVDDSNIAENAGLPEAWVEWDPADGHDHRDGSLSPRSVSDACLDVIGEDSVQWVLTQSPGTKTIVGVSRPFPYSLPQNMATTGLTIDIVWGEGSPTGGSFPDGTVPVVKATLWDYQDAINSAAIYTREIYVESVTSKGCRLRYVTNNIAASPTANLRVFYMAIGIAPGYLTSPTGV